MIFDIDGIEEKIGYVFKDKMLLRKCFTHSSYANEHKESNNERLEFFGDTIIKFIETEYLFKNVGGDEGDLTVARQKIENNDFFLETVKKLELDKFVLLGNGQRKNAHHDEKLFSSVFEALVAGIYLDGGMEAAKRFVKNTVITDFEKTERFKDRRSVAKDYKSEFQEFVQKRKLGSVSYETLSKNGPEHVPEYRAAALLNGKRLAEGKGPSKKYAEAVAASVALAKLKKQDGRKL